MKLDKLDEPFPKWYCTKLVNMWCRHLAQLFVKRIMLKQTGLSFKYWAMWVYSLREMANSFYKVLRDQRNKAPLCVCPLASHVILVAWSVHPGLLRHLETQATPTHPFQALGY